MMKHGTLLAAALATMDAGPSHRPSWADDYHRPGGHRSAKAAAKANKRRAMEKKTKKQQRRKR